MSKSIKLTLGLTLTSTLVATKQEKRNQIKKYISPKLRFSKLHMLFNIIEISTIIKYAIKT